MSYKRINIKEANVLIKEPNTFIADIRDEDSFTNSHIQGAINLSQANIGQFIQNTDKEINVLVVCYHGNSSQSVAAYFSQLGFKNVYSLDGGYEAWSNAK